MGKKIRRDKKIAIEVDRELVTVEETADFFRVRTNQIRIWINNGLLKTAEAYTEHKGRLWRRKLILRQSVRDFLEAGEQ